MEQHLQNKKGLVQNVFDQVYDQYDLMNDLMSLGIHRLWKKNMLNMMNPSNNQKLIDVRNEFEKYNLISALHTFKSKEDKIYENLLPPLDLLDSIDEKNLMENLEKLDFQINSKLAA